jgi:cytochrome b involved in lipid metabolism
MSNLKDITLEELKLNNGEGESNLWVLIDGQVYDVTNFDHPGGKEILRQKDLLNYQDKFEEFEEVGHSPLAIKQMKKFLIGKLNK